MKQLRKTICILLVIPLMGFSQITDQKDSTNSKLISAARDIMQAAGTCALITVDETGIPMVRIMDPFPAESDFTVWLGTNPNSRKVTHIKENPNVTLYYSDSDASGYVVIHGLAQLVNEKKEKEAHWKDAWQDFYPDKTNGYLLIKVSPQWMEVLSVKRGITGDPVTWQVPIVKFDAKE